jgi:hypothetical protein
MLGSLSRRATLNDLVKTRSVKRRSKLYLRDVEARWANEEKTNWSMLVDKSILLPDPTTF